MDTEKSGTSSWGSHLSSEETKRSGCSCGGSENRKSIWFFVFFLFFFYLAASRSLCCAPPRGRLSSTRWRRTECRCSQPLPPRSWRRRSGEDIKSSLKTLKGDGNLCFKRLEEKVSKIRTVGVYLPSSCCAPPWPCFAYLCRQQKMRGLVKNHKHLQYTRRRLKVCSPFDFVTAGSILKTRTAWWPLLTLIFFTSSMSGSEFIAQRKLAFHVLGSHVLPSTCLPADGGFFCSLASSLCLACKVCRAGGELLTCVDGPQLEQAGIFFNRPAVSGRMLPGNREYRFLLQKKNKTTKNTEYNFSSGFQLSKME